MNTSHDQPQTELNELQVQRAVEVMTEYLDAPTDDGRTRADVDALLDSERVKLIEGDLGSAVTQFLHGQLPLAEFKSTVDSLNKRHELWGFKGIKGQMFFNMLVNVSDDIDECDQELKAAISVPENDQIASSRIKTFASYVNRLRESWFDSGNSRRGAPQLGSVLFFLTYFWQIQDRDSWPVYYTTAVNTLSDLNIWQATGNLSDDYVSFKRLNHLLAGIFSKRSGRSFDLYGVEHVLYFKSEAPYSPSGQKLAKTSPGNRNEDTTQISGNTPIAQSAIVRLPDSFVPPIVEILPRIARNDVELVGPASNSGTSLERAFEKGIDAALTILGYDEKLMGQGAGRVPDGLAIARDENYAIIWDAKVRADRYSMGTDDRTIKEYIVSQSRELKRRRSMRNIYYVIVSSKFADDFDDAIRSIKMETDVSEVCLMEAGALVAMVDAKLRAPLEVTLGPDGLQRLFTVSGVLSGENVRQYLL